MPTLDDFRNKTGDFADDDAAEEQDAAASVEQEQEDTQEVEDREEVEETTDKADDQANDVGEETDDDEPELTEREKTAFEKRLEREKRKLREQLQQEMESQFAGHKRVVEQLGGDPDQIMQALQERQMQMEAAQQAQRLADYYGWDDEQIQQYTQQQVRDRQQQIQQEQLRLELQELRISSQINDLRDNPEYAGIGGIKKEIADVVARSNGTLTVEQAYWALGGAKRAQQTRREAEQRAAAQRRTRVVANDSPASASLEKAIPSEILHQAKALGMSEKEVRELMDFDASNIKDFRAKKKK